MIGRTISHYRVVERLGAGGMGVVYKAEDTRLGRMVAIKLLSDELLKDRTAMERFQREARAASALNHPNICTIHEIDEVDGMPFLVMEFLEGETLRDRLDHGPIPGEQLIDLAMELAGALATAHEARIIHRDLKPANLFLTRQGHVKILDFGLAKVMSDLRDDSATLARDLTAAETTVGTIAYMSPEQARAETLDARTDLFSFGAVLYELATGTRAFAAPTTALTFDRILHHDPPPPATSLAPVIMKALQKDRELRYQSAAEIRADLRRLKHDSTAPTVATAPIAVRRKPYVVAVAAIVVIAALAGVWLWRGRGAKSRTARGTKTVAVLPFANLSGKSDRDYLTLALPDELITILSYNRALAVRPFALSRRFSGDADPQKSGRALNATEVITGHFRDAAGRIDVTLEAIDVEQNNVLWRDSVNVAGDDLLALREQLATRIRTGLLPLLSPGVGHSGPSRPKSDEAYALVLRAAALSNDPAPNKEAWTMLERAVALDPSYAPAWSALASRAYNDGAYGEGGDAATRRAEEASMRAIAIDPDLVDPLRRVILLRAEKGDVTGAYREATELMRRRPDLSESHFAMSYVYRYAGLLRESAAECERARTIDPHNQFIRSCALVFMLLNDAPRARQFMALDGSSIWARAIEAHLRLRAGDGRGAVALQPGISEGPIRLWLPLLRAYMEGRPEAEQASLSKAAKEGTLQIRDGEPCYFNATVLAFCRRDADALELLRTAVERGYCSYPALDSDPAFAHLRSTPEFKKIREAAAACRQRFLSATSPAAPSAPPA